MAITSLSRTHPITQRLLFGGMTVCIIAIVSLNAYLLMREHRTAELAAIRTSLNIVSLIDRDVQNTVELYDSALSTLIRVSKRADLNTLSQPLKHMLLFDKAKEAPANGGFFLLNAQGDLIAESRSLPIPKQNFSHWPSFIAHRDSTSDALFISQTPHSVDNQEVCCISFSRRISGPGDSFQGVAIAFMKKDYFMSLFQKLDLGSNSTISLINTDSTLLIQHPERDDLNVDLSLNPIFTRLLKENRGSFIAISSRLEQEKLYTFSEVGNLPLVVVVSLATEDVFSSWRRNAIILGCMTAILCIVLLALTGLLGRELHLRRQVEEKLEALIRTDSLTGLANRRQLDETLNNEWLRAHRSGKPLSLIMIDVDHFKTFNDTYGHQCGDEVLRLLGKTLQSLMRRSTDLVARYGGEEFAIVLSETDANGAIQLAERIRQAIEALQPITPDKAKITVSVGISTQQVKPGKSLVQLIHSADQALYQAKKQGRNCVVSSDAGREV